MLLLPPPTPNAPTLNYTSNNNLTKTKRVYYQKFYLLKYYDKNKKKEGTRGEKKMKKKPKLGKKGKKEKRLLNG